ncbi:MAG: nucleotidyltransferase family protein [Chloroflexota bacterium]
MSIAAAVVLAAGAGSRFGGQKLLAELGGTPILQYVLNLCAVAALNPVVVVLGSDADALVTRLWWRDEVRLINPSPEDGISSSVRMGLAALSVSDADRALVLLGDQPRLTAAQIGAILVVPPDAARPIVVPRFQGQPGNPVLLERAAWLLADELRGDTGMVQMFKSRAELVRYVDLPGVNPDIDTATDLAALDSAPQR